MNQRSLRAYVDQTASILEDASTLSLRHTQLRLVEPFLEALGWEPGGTDVHADTTVRGRTVDYVLAVDGTPTAIVDCRPYGHDILPGEEETFRAILRRAGVERGLLTDGATFVGFVAAEHGFDRRIVDRGRLPERVEELRPFVNPTSADRPSASTTDRDDTDGWIDTPDEVDSTSAGDDRNSAHGQSSTAESPRTTGESIVEAVDDSVEAEGETGARNGIDDRTESSETRYVVRFFGERGSIGAVGHCLRDEAVRHALTFLFERGVNPDLPWTPPDEDVVALDDGEISVGGDPVDRVVALEGGQVFNTSGSDDVVADRLSTLAATAGLRTMFQGRWSPSPDTPS